MSGAIDNLLYSLVFPQAIFGETRTFLYLVEDSQSNASLMKSTRVSEQKERNNQLIRWCLVFENRDKLRRALGRMSRQRRRWSGGVSRWTQERIENGGRKGGLKVAGNVGLRGAMAQGWRPPRRKEARERETRRWAAREEDRAKDEVSAGADERTLTSYYLLIANSFSLVAY